MSWIIPVLAYIYWASCSNTCNSVTKQYNLLPAFKPGRLWKRCGQTCITLSLPHQDYETGMSTVLTEMSCADAACHYCNTSTLFVCMSAPCVLSVLGLCWNRFSPFSMTRSLYEFVLVISFVSVIHSGAVLE